MQPIINNRFYLSDSYMEIYEASARRTPYGNWEVSYADLDIMRGGDSACNRVNQLLMQAQALGVIDRVKKVLVNPVVAMLLVDEHVLTTEHFSGALMRSTAYFDLPAVRFGIDLPVRVAQFPKEPTTLVTERGYPVL